MIGCGTVGWWCAGAPSLVGTGGDQTRSQAATPKGMGLPPGACPDLTGVCRPTREHPLRLPYGVSGRQRAADTLPRAPDSLPGRLAEPQSVCLLPTR